jgi:hypothetical protein
MGKNGHEFVKERFDSKRLGEHLITIFDGLF